MRSHIFAWSWWWQGWGSVAVDADQGNLLPGRRFGFVTVWWCRGHWAEQAAQALREAALRLRGEKK